ncbi:AMP-binding protein [Prosthecochloris vibrioformis]|uniref:Long-chain fatty acid--CoA ligase n=1 Tax=Prosthecochloris vibrioformis TaxID=1098 RepID=A0A5C4S1F1_PROVB|nr:AMP-binding protein [Prosthecochloris vibrioformis]TNJ37039.1 long-chain fatty acid--CoA ligase [Prosthecochloris vibrioformis]
MQAYPWIRHYDEGVPASLEPYPDMTLPQVVAGHAEAVPDEKALLFKGAAVSWSELDEKSTRLSKALGAKGIVKGDRVALIMPNTPSMVIAELAIWKLGAIVVPMNPLYTEDELKDVLRECGASAAIVLSPFYRKLQEVRKHYTFRFVIAASVAYDLTFLTRALFRLFKEKKEGHRISLVQGDMWLSELMESEHAGHATNIEAPLPDDPALFLFTGGTTGRPKCAVCTHKAMISSAMQISSWFKVVLKDTRPVVLLNMPLFHVYSQIGVFGVALVEGYPSAPVPNPRDLDDLIATIRKLKPAVLPGVPTLFNALIAHPKVRNGSNVLGSVKLSVSGASPLILETKKRFEALTGGHIIDAYSLTEAMIASVLTPIHGMYKEGAVGIPAPDVVVRILDPEDRHRELVTGEVGEVVMRAPQMMLGYWNRDEESAEMLRDGWLHTGDLGYMDEDGYLFIIDRKKDVIKPGGFQVWPRDVEEVLATHPDIREVGVAGVPDNYQGEAVKAWVVPREGCQPDPEELRNFCRQKLAGYKVPRYIELIDALPKSAVGKVLRRELAASHRL